MTLQSLLRFAPVYSWFVRQVGGDHSRARYVREYLHVSPGMRVLDKVGATKRFSDVYATKP